MAKKKMIFDHPSYQEEVKKLRQIENPTPDDYRRALEAALVGINRDMAMEGAPVRSLKEILEQKSLKDLKRYARYHSLKNLGGIEKGELAVRLLEAVCDAQRLDEEIECMAEEEWIFFAELIQNGTVDKEAVPRGMIPRLLDGGYVHLFYHEGKIIYVLPDEVRAAYDTLDTEHMQNYKQMQSIIDEYARAAVNLYGAISLDEFDRLVNRLAFSGKAGFLEGKMYGVFLDGYDGSGDDYTTWEEYLVSGDFVQDDGEIHAHGVKALLDDRRGKPRYQPSAETFLKYADPDYYEITPQVSALRLALVSFQVDEKTAGHAIDMLHDVMAGENDTNEMFHVLERYGIVLEFEQLKTILNLITDMSNHTRLWSNYGHTPDEMFRRRGGGAPRPMMPGGMQLPKAQGHAGMPGEWGRPVQEPGQPMAPDVPQGNIPRNGPCPCGSGKKYKHCCGSEKG